MSSTRSELVHLAKMAEQGERFDDMVDYTKQLGQLSEPLDVEERNLLSVAFKYVVGSRRSAYRVLCSIEDKESKRNPDGYKLQIIKDYKLKLEGELDGLCLDLLDQILTESFIEKTTETASKVFFLKMKGDYYRYMAEYKKGEASAEVVANANTCYSKAWALAEKELGPTDPIRLGLVLNYSVFYFEIMNEPEKACELAKSSFETANEEMDKLDESVYKDAMLIMQLLHDNLSLWTPPREEEPVDSPKQDDVDA